MNAMKHKYVAAKPTPPSSLQRLGPRRWAYHQPVRPHRAGFVLFRRLVFGLLLALFLALLASFALRMWVDNQTEELIYTPDNPNIPRQHVAIVFGAGLNTAGGPSAMLYDRVATAVKLYQDDRVDKLLMTGDNSALNYNEVEVMRRTAVGLGIPDEDIVLDYAGFSTWDSCYRARDIFDLTEATLVTQRFHLPRALYACKELGVKPIGVEADIQPYPTWTNEARELPALLSTLWKRAVNEKPRFLGPKVDVDEPQQR